MISKKQISLITSLQHKKFRKEHGLFIAEGEKVVSELLRSDFKIRELYVTQTFYENHFSLLKTDINPIVITDEELKKISALTTPQQVLALAEIPNGTLDISKVKNNLTLLLDDIQDPGNSGTIIRIADWFGISTIICSTSSADAFNPKVVQASMGSLFRVKVFYLSLELFLEENKNGARIPVYGTLLKGNNIYKTSLTPEGFILIGNESKGVSEGLKKYITSPLSIPSFSLSENIDSLNAAMATAIICSEFRRR